MKKAPKNPATPQDVVGSLDSVRIAESTLDNALTKFKDARKAVREARAELRRKKRQSKRAYKSALNRKPIR